MYIRTLVVCSYSNLAVLPCFLACYVPTPWSTRVVCFFFFLLGKFAILGVHFVDSPFFYFLQESN